MVSVSISLNIEQRHIIFRQTVEFVTHQMATGGRKCFSWIVHFAALPVGQHALFNIISK